MHAAATIRRLFALPARRHDMPPVPADFVARLRPTPGTITLVTGGSGGGKTRLLRELKFAHAVDWVDPAALPLGESCVIDSVCDALEADDQRGVESALELLSRVGLAEAWTYLQKPAELSDGQRWRLRLALAVARAGRSPAGEAVLAIDEFAALLDRVTARVVARALRRLIDRPHGPRLAAVVVTSHDDLAAALAPDTHVVADFGEYRILTPSPGTPGEGGGEGLRPRQTT